MNGHGPLVSRINPIRMLSAKLAKKNGEATSGRQSTEHIARDLDDALKSVDRDIIERNGKSALVMPLL